MDATDKNIINRLQDGLPICECPYVKIASELNIGEDELLSRLQALLDNKILSRFGPMYDASQFGGFVTLAALQVDGKKFDHIAELVNNFPEVAHNYRREHKFNMWFVISAETKTLAERTITQIEKKTGHHVYNMPKLDEFYVGLKLAV